MINLSILDDHHMVIHGIETMLEGSDIKIANRFTKGKQLLEAIPKAQPDVLLLDINLPDANGLELCKILSKKYPKLAILALSNYSDNIYIKRMLKNGARGYLLKNTDRNELILAIHTVAKGDLYLSPNIKNQLLHESIGQPSKSGFIPRLTRREKEILNLIAKQNTNQEIANLLHISTKTVESHRNNLLQKLGVRNTAGLIKLSIEKGLI